MNSTPTPSARFGEAPAPAGPPGAFTLRTAGALFVASAVFELASPYAAVPLLGSMRGGAIALVYHAVTAAVFLAMGAALLTLRPIGVRIFFVGTALYTLDKALFLLDKATRDAYVADKLPELQGLIDRATFEQATYLSAMVVVALTWGFAIYVYFRRGSFQAPRA